MPILKKYSLVFQSGYWFNPKSRAASFSLVWPCGILARLARRAVRRHSKRRPSFERCSVLPSVAYCRHDRAAANPIAPHHQASPALPAVAKCVARLHGEVGFCRFLDAPVWRKFATTRFMLRLALEEILRMGAFRRWVARRNSVCGSQRRFSVASAGVHRHSDGIARARSERNSDCRRRSRSRHRTAPGRHGPSIKQALAFIPVPGRERRVRHAANSAVQTHARYYPACYRERTGADLRPLKNQIGAGRKNAKWTIHLHGQRKGASAPYFVHGLLRSG